MGVTQAFAASVLRNTAGLVQFVVGRDVEPGESEVAQLIRQSVQDDREGEEEKSGGSKTALMASVWLCHQVWRGSFH